MAKNFCACVEKNASEAEALHAAKRRCGCLIFYLVSSTRRNERKMVWLLNGAQNYYLSTLSSDLGKSPEC